MLRVLSLALPDPRLIEYGGAIFPLACAFELKLTFDASCAMFCRAKIKILANFDIFMILGTF